MILIERTALNPGKFLLFANVSISFYFTYLNCKWSIWKADQSCPILARQFMEFILSCISYNKEKHKSLSGAHVLFTHSSGFCVASLSGLHTCSVLHAGYFQEQSLNLQQTHYLLFSSAFNRSVYPELR